PSQWVKPWQMVSLETAPTAPERRQPLSDSNPALPLLSANYFTEFAGGKKWRVGIFNNYYTNLAIAVDIDNFDHGMDQLKRSYYFVLPLALLLAASGAWWIAQRSLGPVKALTRAVKDVSVERLENRLGGESYEIEFQGLIDKYNEMMERLEKSFLQSSRFSADASHELKTPLARLQVELEQALKKSKTNSETRKIFSSLLDEVVRLKTIIEKLLLLSASDSGKLTLNLRRVNLSELLANVVEDCETMAGAHLIKADLEREVFVNADRLLLEQALQNLASNALKYGEKGSLVQFALKQNKERIRMQVSNSGSSIGPEDKDRIFERFFRLDTVRNGNESGTGLGLSLSREIVRAHGGELYLDDSVKNQTVFVIELPA
ncbi:MAG: two-component sensor histidine kinase, partial [Verrucomicrobiae bacterium]|nr:two-component sensor histidine kinase [Verrucomicrobiae bacterium]